MSELKQNSKHTQEVCLKKAVIIYSEPLEVKGINYPQTALFFIEMTETEAIRRMIEVMGIPSTLEREVLKTMRIQTFEFSEYFYIESATPIETDNQGTYQTVIEYLDSIIDPISIDNSPNNR